MRKNVWKRILAMASVFCLTLGTVSISAQAEDAAKPSYVALGDSITTGYGVNDDSAFPSLLAGEMGYELKNLAAEGATSADLLVQVQDSAVASADVITITIGGNDLMNALYDYLAAAYNAANDTTTMTGEYVKEALTSGDMQMLMFAVQSASGFTTSSAAISALATFTQNLESAVDKIKEVNPDALVFVATQYNPYKWLPDSCDNETYKSYLTTIAQTFEAGVQALNGAIATVANKTSAFVPVDVYAAFNSSSDNLSNASYAESEPFPGLIVPSVNLDFHPNSAGHQVIATTMEAAINTTVQKVFTQAGAVVSALGTLTVDQKDISSAETAQAWAASQIQSLPVSGVSVSGSVQNFVAATAGTADKQDGTNGSFEVNVTFSLLGQTKTAVVPVTIKATAYTAPAQDPSKEEGGKDPTDGQVTQTTKPDKVNTPADNNKKAVPKTGDMSHPMIYVVLLLGAAAVVVISRKRISRQ